MGEIVMSRCVRPADGYSDNRAEADSFLRSGPGPTVRPAPRVLSHALRFLFYMHTLLPEAPRAIAIAAAAPAAHRPPLVPRNVSHERANI